MRTTLLLLALLAPANSAYAQTTDPEALLRDGVALRRERRDAEALTLFQRAYDGSHSPRALAQVGLAEQALGRWVEAETHVREALAATADSWITRNAPSLRAALGVIAQHLGGLWIDGGVEGAEVFVDGQRVATLPMSAATRVVAGSVSVEVRAQGHASVTRQVVVPGGGEAREVVRLNRVSSGDPSPPGPVSPAPPSAVRTESRPGQARRVLAWVSLAGAAVGVGVGVGALVVREVAVGQYNPDAACPGQRSAVQPGDCGDLIRTADSMQLLGTIAFVAGGALAVTSVVLFATAPAGEGSPRPAARFGCGVGPGAPGVACGGRF